MSLNINDPVLKVSFFKTESGQEPVRDWLLELKKKDRKIIGEDIKTAQFGWPIGMPLIRKFEAGIWEVRSRIENGIARTFFTVMGDNIILIHGFIKKPMSTPKNEIKIARDRLKKLKRG
jgi:phage-related protein